MRNNMATRQDAAQTPDEAGATPPFDARCVTGLVGSLPPRAQVNCAKGLGRVSDLEFEKPPGGKRWHS